MFVDAFSSFFLPDWMVFSIRSVHVSMWVGELKRKRRNGNDLCAFCQLKPFSQMYGSIALQGQQQGTKNGIQKNVQFFWVAEMCFFFCSATSAQPALRWTEDMQKQIITVDTIFLTRFTDLLCHLLSRINGHGRHQLFRGSPNVKPFPSKYSTFFVTSINVVVSFLF